MQDKNKKSNIYWVTDSENIVNFIKKGSKKPHIQEMVFNILKLAAELEIHIEPIHLFRQDPRIQLADEGSGQLDTDNWSIDGYSFCNLEEQFNFETDVFADSKNR